jgi:hypothetical protein
MLRKFWDYLNEELLLRNEEIDRKQKRVNQYKEKKFKKWKRKALLTFVSSLLLTTVFWSGYLMKFSFPRSEAFWNMVSKSGFVTWAGVAFSFAWNGFIGRMLYDRYYDPSKEKAFKELISIPSDI